MVPHPPLIVPEVGKGEEKKIQDTIDAYHRVAGKIGELKPETIVLISPHQIMYADYFHISPGKGAKGDFSQFRAGRVKMEVSYDTQFVEKLCMLADEKHLPAGILGEREKKLDHGTMVPLFFVEQYWKNYQLVRIGLSGLSLMKHYELGQCIQQAAEALGKRVILIGSGDLSHRLKEDGPYGYQAEGPLYDSRIMDVMGRGAFGELLEFQEEVLAFRIPEKDRMLRLWRGNQTQEDIFNEAEERRRNDTEAFLQLVEKAAQIVVVCAGARGRALLKLCGKLGTGNIRAVCDNAPAVQGQTVEGMEVMSVERAVRQYPKACYMIANQCHVEELSVQLAGAGISAEQISVYGEGIYGEEAVMKFLFS